MIRWLSPLFLCLPLVLSAAEAPEQLVAHTTERLLAELNKMGPDRDPAAVYSLLEEIVSPHFDFERMSRWVLGKHWRRVDAAQRDRFTAEFHRLLVRTYGAAVTQYDNQVVKYQPPRTGRQGTVLVRTLLVMEGGPPVPIHYALRERHGRWLVIDVTVDGVSLVANYRSTFSREIQQAGIDGLVSRLAEQNR